MRFNASSIDVDVQPTACWLRHTTLNRSLKPKKRKIRSLRNKLKRKKRLNRRQLRIRIRLSLKSKKNLYQKKKKKLQTLNH